MIDANEKKKKRDREEKKERKRNRENLYKGTTTPSCLIVLTHHQDILPVQFIVKYCCAKMLQAPMVSVGRWKI